MPIKIETPFDSTAEALWRIVGVPDRTDWVPGVTGCEWDGTVRRLSMPGAGEIAERILSVDDAAMKIEYSCIESVPPLDYHLASIEVIEEGDRCRMIWCTEVQPAAFEPFIRESMAGCLQKIEALLA